MHVCDLEAAGRYTITETFSTRRRIQLNSCAVTNQLMITRTIFCTIHARMLWRNHETSRLYMKCDNSRCLNSEKSVHSISEYYCMWLLCAAYSG